MKALIQIRKFSAVGIFVIVGLLLSIRFCASEVRLYMKSKGRDATSVALERFEPLKRVLPPHQVVGYVSDNGSLSSFFLTRYALAPTATVIYGTNSEWVIANLTGKEVNLNLVTNQSEFVVSREFGRGVFLMHRKAR